MISKKQLIELEVRIDSDLVDQLKKDSMRLCIARSVRSRGPNSQLYPIIWAALDNYSSKTTFLWSQDGYEVFISESQVHEGIPLKISSSHEISMGENLIIQEESGKGIITPKTEGSSGNIVIENDTRIAITTGLSHQIKINEDNYVVAPICAQTIEPQRSMAILPTHKVFVVLASNISPGTAITKFMGQGILVRIPKSSEFIDTDSEKITKRVMFTKVKHADGDLKAPEWRIDQLSEEDLLIPIFEGLNLFDYLADS